MDITVHTVTTDGYDYLEADVFVAHEDAAAFEAVRNRREPEASTNLQTHTVHLSDAYEGALAVEVEGVEPDRIALALNEGLGAFWTAVTRVFPEVESGDMDPGGQLLMEQTMANMLAAWLTYNHPDAHES